MSKRISLLVGLSLSSFVGAAHAASIGIQFFEDANSTALAPTDTAGVAAVAQSNWNVINGTPAITGSALKDNAGTATTTSITSSNNGGGYRADSGFPVGSGDRKLASSAFLSLYGGTTSVTLTGIPYANYDVYLYGESDAAGRETSVSDGTSFSSYTSQNGASAWTLATGTWDRTGTPPNDPAANYVKFSGETNANPLTLSWYAPGNGGINGIQIVQATPEPATLGLIGLGAIALGSRRRKL